LQWYALWASRLGSLSAMMRERQLGSLRIEGNRVVLRGDATTAAHREETERLAQAQIPPGFRLESQIAGPASPVAGGPLSGGAASGGASAGGATSAGPAAAGSSAGSPAASSAPAAAGSSAIASSSPLSGSGLSSSAPSAGAAAAAAPGAGAVASS